MMVGVRQSPICAKLPQERPGRLRGGLEATHRLFEVAGAFDASPRASVHRSRPFDSAVSQKNSNRHDCQYRLTDLRAALYTEIVAFFARGQSSTSVAKCAARRFWPPPVAIFRRFGGAKSVK